MRYRIDIFSTAGGIVIPPEDILSISPPHRSLSTQLGGVMANVSISAVVARTASMIAVIQAGSLARATIVVTDADNGRIVSVGTITSPISIGRQTVEFHTSELDRWDRPMYASLTTRELFPDIPEESIGRPIGDFVGDSAGINSDDCICAMAAPRVSQSKTDGVHLYLASRSPLDAVSLVWTDDWPVSPRMYSLFNDPNTGYAFIRSSITRPELYFDGRRLLYDAKRRQSTDNPVVALLYFLAGAAALSYPTAPYLGHPIIDVYQQAYQIADRAFCYADDQTTVRQFVERWQASFSGIVIPTPPVSVEQLATFDIVSEYHDISTIVDIAPEDVIQAAPGTPPRQELDEAPVFSSLRALYQFQPRRGGMFKTVSINATSAAAAAEPSQIELPFCKREALASSICAERSTEYRARRIWHTMTIRPAFPDQLRLGGRVRVDVGAGIVSGIRLLRIYDLEMVGGLVKLKGKDLGAG